MPYNLIIVEFLIKKQTQALELVLQLHFDFLLRPMALVENGARSSETSSSIIITQQEGKEQSPLTDEISRIVAKENRQCGRLQEFPMANKYHRQIVKVRFASILIQLVEPSTLVL
jgi:hypothetical protein